MLRWAAALLLLANLGFWAWSGGRLDGVTGVSAQGDREPERLALQVRPESIRLLPAEEAAEVARTAAPAAGASRAASGASAVASAAAPARTVASAALPASAAASATFAAASAAGPALACLEAGPFAPADLAAARAALSPIVPAARLSERRSEAPGLWLIYMGRYGDPELLQKKKEEVAGIRVAFEELTGYPDLEPGLVLGRFDNRAAADAALARSVTQGIRTARVVMVRAPVASTYLRVQAADPALAAQLEGVTLGPAARGFRSC